MISIAMLIALPMGVAPFIHALNYPNPYVTIESFCKLRTYILQVTTMMYRWGLAIACIDRCALTSTSTRWRALATTRNACRLIAVLFLIWLTLPVQILVLFTLRDGRCGVFQDTGTSLYYSSYTITMGSLLPASIMFICALRIRKTLVNKRELRQQLTSNATNDEQQWQRKRDQQVFVMLLLQAIFYFVTQTPWMLMYFYSASTMLITNKSADRVAIERFVTFVADMILFLLPAASFYLYTLVSRSFRQELKRLFGYLRPRGWAINLNRVRPTSHATQQRAMTEPPPVLPAPN